MTEIQPVAPSPIPVKVIGESHSARQSQLNDPSLAATTTFQEDLTTEGQRKVNLIWEYTQAVIALLVVLTTMIAAGYSMVKEVQVPTIVAVAFGTVVGFYFSRTNHAAIGSIGPKPVQKYEGR